MRILVIAPHPYFIDRGTPIDLDILLRALSLRGEQVDVVCYPGGEDRDYSGVTLYRGLGLQSWHRRPGFSLGKLVLDVLMIPTVLRLAFTRQYDIVHAGEEGVFLALVLRLVRGLPYVYDMDSSLAQQMVEQYPVFKPFARLFDFLETQAIRKATAVAPVCNALSDLVERRGASRVVTLHDISQLQQPELAPSGVFAEEWNIHRGVILYVGNLQPYQGIGLLIDAFAIAVERGSELDLVVAGGLQKDIAFYDRQAAALGVGDRVHCIGHWPNSELGDLLAQAQILTSPRVTGINTPMKVFPYLHSGVPLLATEIETHTQILDETIACLAPADPNSFAEGILKLERDPDLRTSIGEAGRDFVENNHTFDAHVSRVNQLYDYLLMETKRANSLTSRRSEGHASDSKLVRALKQLPIDLGQASYRTNTKGKRIALGLVPKGKGRSALDIGCCEGIQSEWLKQRGYKVTSMDVASTYPGAIVADANRELPFASEQFDLIWCSEVIEHLERPESFKTEVDRLLKPGGRLLLTTPNSAFWIYPVARLFGRTPADLQNPTHLHFFNQEDIRRLFPEGCRILGYFPYSLIKVTISRGVGLLSPTFVVDYVKPIGSKNAHTPD